MIQNLILFGYDSLQSASMKLADTALQVMIRVGRKDFVCTISLFWTAGFQDNKVHDFIWNDVTIFPRIRGKQWNKPLRHSFNFVSKTIVRSFCFWDSNSSVYCNSILLDPIKMGLAHGRKNPTKGPGENQKFTVRWSNLPVVIALNPEGNRSCAQFMVSCVVVVVVVVAVVVVVVTLMMKHLTLKQIRNSKGKLSCDIQMKHKARPGDPLTFVTNLTSLKLSLRQAATQVQPISLVKMSQANEGPSTCRSEGLIVEGIPSNASFCGS